MGKSQHTITINADIQATLKDMDKVVSKLNRDLRDGTTKIDLTKGVGNSISKQIDTFKTEYQKFANLTKNNQIDFINAKEAIRSGEQVIKTFSELRRIVGNFEDLTIFDAKKMFPDAFDSKVGELHKKLTSLSNSITELNNKKIELDSAKNAVLQLEEKSKKLQSSLEEKTSIKIDTTSAQQELDEANDKIERLRKDLKDQLHLKLTVAEQTKSKGKARIEEIQAARKSRGATKAPESLTSLKQRGASADEIIAGRKAIELYKEEQKEINAIEEELKKAERAANGYRAALADSDAKKLTDLAKAGEASADEIKEINEALEAQKIATDNVKIANEKLAKHQEEVGNIEKELADTNKELENQRTKVERLDKAYKALQSKVSPENLTKALQEILPNFDKDLLTTEEGIKQLQEQLDKIDEQNYSKLIQSLQDMGLTADSAEDYIKLLRQSLQEIAGGAKDIKQAEDEIENLKNQVLQFFSITNSIQLFKRVVSDAINTIKELDAVMTETAVVTDFTVGDMWEKLPTYSKQATALGASISDLYSATTLYYQQGLKTNEAMGVGIETMKMARIANMDATDATTDMTAALRGFNMEVNELNAQRVNDVYSELAAITAADTNQIATAMGKTASIASSANMEFETTAALLAQIIETTQEAPETAGTAMKTIIARFTEVKELFNEGMLTGKDDEGEEININKIDKALRSVGISLKDFLNGSKGMDDIFLELASKWDNLDLATQRYIATMAAGSRQQSRFIAMMSNYDRTMELVGAANNSVGASQKQFNKTLDSLEAKLQKLKNAWDEFAMGLANDEIIKFGVDLLTGILETINKITEAISGGNGFVKSLVSLATAIGALKGGESLFNMILGKSDTNGRAGGFFGDFISKEGIANLDQANGKTQLFALNLQGVGMAAIGAGSALTLLAQLAEKQGNKEWAEGIQAVGAAFTGVGSAVVTLGPILKAFNVQITSAGIVAGKAGAMAALGWGPFIGVLAAVAVAIGLVALAFYNIHTSSPEYKLEQATKAADEAAEAANEAAEAYDNLKTSLDSLDDKRAALDNLTAGTKEWKEAIVDINNEVLDLIEKYPELAKFVKPQNNGALGFTSESIDGQTVDSVMNDYYQKTISTQAAKVAAQIKQQEAQQAVDLAGLSDSAKETKEESRVISQYGVSPNSTIETTYKVQVVDEEATRILAKEIAQNKHIDMLDSKPERYEELRKFGQELLASEKAIETFQLSLLDTAVVNANISEEMRDDLGRLYDAEYINKLLEGKERELGVIDSKDRAEYAKAQGYDYKYGKFYDIEGKEVKVSDEDIKTQLAAIKVQNDLISKVENLAAIMSKLSARNSSLSELFGRLTSGEGLELTLHDLNQLDANRGNLWNEFGSLYESREDFDRVVNTAKQTATLALTQAQAKLEHIGVSGLDNNTQLSVEAYSGLVESLYETFLTSGTQGASSLGQSISNILSGMDASQAEIFTNALNTIDWTNLDDIENFEDTLTDLGFTAVVSEEELEKFKKSMIENNKALRHFDLEKIKEELVATEKLIDGIKERDRNERTFTKEEAELMLKADPSLANSFVSTGIDEFTYIGTSMDALVIALNKNTQAQLEEYGKQVREKAEISEKWFDESNKSAVETILQAYENEQIGANRGAIESAIKTLGIDEGRDIANYSDEDLLSIIRSGYEAYYGTGGAVARTNIEARDFYNTQQAQLAYQAGERTDYALLQEAQGGNEYAQNQILAEAVGYAELSDEIQEYNELLDENGELKVEVTEEDRKAALQQIKFKTELAKAKKEMKDYGEKTNNLIDELEDLDKNSEDYKDVLADLATETNKYLDSDISGEFFEQGNNLELLQNALEGDADAWEQFVTNAMIAKAATEDMVTDYGIQMEDIAAMTQAMDDLTFDVNGTADVSQLVEEFLRAGGEASKVAEYLEELGLTNIDIEADIAGAKTFEGIAEAAGSAENVTLPIGSIKATNVRLAKSNFNSFRSGRGKSSGGGGSKENPWENSFDKLYNLVHKIDEELHQRERIERRYEKLLEAIDTSANKIVDVSQEELAQLEKERMLQEQLASGRKKQIVEYQAENSDLNKYAGVTQNERGEDVLRIDWDAINAVTDADEGQRIEDYVSQLEEWFEELDSAEEALWDIEDAVEEIKDRGKDEYFNLEEAIKDALVDSYQAEIDKLGEVNESINNTNDELLKAIQSSIDKQRQDRENQRTEEDLEQKQRRLAYLQQDTSGANAMEILRLQEEISRGQEDYTDSLIDQKISELQQQNDEAAKQREKQIDLLQNQLDHYIETGGIWDEVYQLMDAGLDEESGLIRGSHLEKILQDSANFSGMSELEKVEWLNDTNDMIAQGLAYLELGRQLEDIGVKAGEQIEFTNKDGQKLTGTVDENGNVVASDGKTYTNVYQGADGKYYARDNIEPVEEPKVENPPQSNTPPTKSEETEKPKDEKPKDEKPKGYKIEVLGNTHWQNFANEKQARLFAESLVKKWETEQLADLERRIAGGEGGYGNNTYKASKKAEIYREADKYRKGIKITPQYKTGGLADFTGPAWLDGSKSRPEIVLDAQDSRNFIQLRDILGSLLNRSITNTSTENNGDITYDIDINVESIGNDYDVDQVANRVKSLINQDARYRNNNAVSLKR